MSEPGYYHSPTLHNDTVVFVCEDDLWAVPAEGGVARRLTANPGLLSAPALSPDGAWLAFTGEDEGTPEVYCMPADGGPAVRLTYLGTDAQVVGWTPDGQSILFASNTAQHFFRIYNLYSIPREGGSPAQLPTGPAFSISFGPNGGRVIGRHTTDIARWKRYRGGLTGDLWIDPDGSGNWQRLIRLPGNLARPLWVGERIYFVSDHEGIGNLYSCLPDGGDLRRHTHHADYYVRRPATDGQRIVYHAGADLYLFDPAADANALIPVQFHSPRARRKRKFVHAADYLQGYHPHPAGHAVAVITRGKLFTMPLWEEAAVQHGEPHGVRYRLAAWLHDGKRLVTVNDADGEERLELHTFPPPAEPDRLTDLDIGRPYTLLPSPCADVVALTNHRHELIVVDLAARTARTLDRSRYNPLQGIAWSPDGRWLAYGFPQTAQTTIIKLCHLESGETYPVTRPLLRDIRPAFDPDGKYLYFLSCRDFNPVPDNLHFDLNFPWGMRPCLLLLQADLPSHFEPRPRPPGDKTPPKEEEDKPAEDHPPGDGDNDDDPPGDEPEKPEKSTPPALRIDLEGIQDRLLAFPVPEGRYGQIAGLKGKVLFTLFPIEGARRQNHLPFGPPPARGKLQVYNFDDLSHDTLIHGVSHFRLSMDGKTLLYRAGNRLRALKAGEKPPRDGDEPGRKTGWLDLGRLKVLVKPQSEWEQMYREAWRLQRDNFWTDDMSGVDWQTVYRRYFPLLKRIATRTEFSDLLWEMQGELGTSHAYEMGGDYPPEPDYPQGFLAADFTYDPDTDSYTLTRIVQGDSWSRRDASPLAKPGLNLKPGDRLLAINGRRVGRDASPPELLLNQAGNEVLLTFAPQNGGEPRSFAVKTLYSEFPVRYREWVETNRRRVHEATGGRVGYIHIPDMGANGYAEFHRAYLLEVDREGLIVDVRNNRGGNVSSLILEKLARRRLGYDIRRHGEPLPYPPESVIGPMVALCNQYSASDGDMFSHAFKMMGLGPLIGVRTWGGVIGIDFRDTLVDGGLTTQPAYSFYFEDVGWKVENYGAEPDIEVEIRPQDYVAGRDPQLERAIEEILRRLEENPPTLPDFSKRPRRTLPILPDPPPAGEKGNG